MSDGSASGAHETARAKQHTVWSLAAPGWAGERAAIALDTTPVTERLVSLAHIGEGDAVLDIACGVGDPAVSIARVVGPGGRVVAVDFVPEMVEGAKATARGGGVEFIEFRVIESELAPHHELAAFDAVTCRFGLMFMPDPVAATRAWRALLRPGGRVALSTWATFPVVGFIAGIIGRHATVPAMDPRAPGVLALPSEDALQCVLDAAGYRDITTERLDVTLFEDAAPAQWWDFMARTAGPIVAILASLSEETRAKVRADGIRALEERHPSGHVSEGGTALVAAATAP
jgi:SAM-dependent methyltransferase